MESESEEVTRLKEKVQALERQNALLKQNKNKSENKKIGVNSKMIEDIKLIDLEDFDGEDEKWLFDVTETNKAVEEELTFSRKDIIRKRFIENLQADEKKCPHNTITYLSVEVRN